MFDNILFETVRSYYNNKFPNNVPTYHKGLKFDLDYDPYVRNPSYNDGWFLLSCMALEQSGRTFRTYLILLCGGPLYYIKVTGYKELDKCKVVAYRVRGVYFKL